MEGASGPVKGGERVYIRRRVDGKDRYLKGLAFGHPPDVGEVLATERGRAYLAKWGPGAYKIVDAEGGGRGRLEVGAEDILAAQAPDLARRVPRLERENEKLVERAARQEVAITEARIAIIAGDLDHALRALGGDGGLGPGGNALRVADLLRQRAILVAGLALVAAGEGEFNLEKAKRVVPEIATREAEIRAGLAAKSGAHAQE